MSALTAITELTPSSGDEEEAKPKVKVQPKKKSLPRKRPAAAMSAAPSEATPPPEAPKKASLATYSKSLKINCA